MVRSQVVLARVIGSTLLLVFLLWFITQRSRPQRISPPWPDKEIVVSEQEADKLISLLGQAIEGRKTGTILLTEEGLTSVLRVYFADTDLGEPTLLVTRQGLYASAIIGRRAPHAVRAFLAVEANRGTLGIRTLGATVDHRAIPRLVLQCMDQVANALLADMAWPVRVDQVVLVDGEMLLGFAPRSTLAR